ncbi:unnamed protein product [Vicia faba]|uniref:Secreted protein n=1 Tax=Vicia faba TaxID=3906 RepID=A0AAV1ARV6_VICFA|nr:unnamed protein product [Vicia faba]
MFLLLFLIWLSFVKICLFMLEIYLYFLFSIRCMHLLRVLDWLTHNLLIQFMPKSHLTLTLILLYEHSFTPSMEQREIPFQTLLTLHQSSLKTLLKNNKSTTKNHTRFCF